MDDRYGWRVYVQWRPELDQWEVYVTRRDPGAHLQYWVTAGPDGALLVHSAEPHTPMAPLFTQIPYELLEALAAGIAKAIGAPQQQQLLEQRTAGAEAKFDYAKALNERLLGILEKQMAALSIVTPR